MPRSIHYGDSLSSNNIESSYLFSVYFSSDYNHFIPINPLDNSFRMSFSLPSIVFFHQVLAALNIFNRIFSISPIGIFSDFQSMPLLSNLLFVYFVYAMYR